MIVDNRITEYLHSLETSRGELLDTIEKKAIEDGVPIIRSETAALLRSLTAALRPENILEIGTAISLPLKNTKNVFLRRKKILEKPGKKAALPF